MNEIKDLTGTAVRYVGRNRDGLLDLIGTVEKVSETGSAGVRYPNGVAEFYKGKDGLVWASRWAWTTVVEPAIKPVAVTRYGARDSSSVAATPENVDDTFVDNIFIEAAGGPRAVMINEINRLTARLADLKKAVEVIDSL